MGSSENPLCQVTVSVPRLPETRVKAKVLFYLFLKLENPECTCFHGNVLSDGERERRGWRGLPRRWAGRGHWGRGGGGRGVAAAHVAAWRPSLALILPSPPTACRQYGATAVFLHGNRCPLAPPSGLQDQLNSPPPHFACAHRSSRLPRTSRVPLSGRSVCIVCLPEVT